jgi:hypothetical protein
VSTTDGPFAETKELIGGYFVIEARDRAEAFLASDQASAMTAAIANLSCGALVD